MDQWRSISYIHTFPRPLDLWYVPRNPHLILQSSGANSYESLLFPPFSACLDDVSLATDDPNSAASTDDTSYRRKIMRYEMTSEWQYEINQEHEVQDLGEEAASFGEFAEALLISLGAVLFVSAGTYLVFTGFVASLLALIA